MNDILFLKELFDIDDIKIEHLHRRRYDIYMTGVFVLIANFDGENLTIAKPSNMSVKKKFAINSKSISEVRKCIEELWIDNYANLAKDN